MKPIIIQGAVDYELGVYLSNMDISKTIEKFGIVFYEGVFKGFDIVISKTGVGLVNASMATALAIQMYDPFLLINQGIAGSHKSLIGLADIVIGEKCVNTNCFISPTRGEGEGSFPFGWKEYKRCITYNANSLLCKLFYKSPYNCGTKYMGTLGSGDFFNREIDRIKWISENFNTSCEDMESYSAYHVSHLGNIPCVGVRIISNNELSKSEYNKSVAAYVQEYILNVIELQGSHFFSIC